jgi:hypothetical protein
MRIFYSLLACLLLLPACSKSKPESPPELVSGEVSGVKFSVKIPRHFQLKSKEADVCLWTNTPGNTLFGPSITIRTMNEWPSDPEQLRRWVLRTNYEILRLEKLPDGFLLTQKRKDNTKVEVVILRAVGPKKLNCSGEAGWTSEPLRDSAEEINQLLRICESLQIEEG